MVEFAMVLLIASGVGLIVYVVITRINPRLAFGQSSISLVAALPHRTGDVIDGLFGLVTLISGVVFVAICLRRYETLSFFGDDFLFFDQAIWNSLRGRLMENTAYLDSPTLLGHHFSPILLAFVPLYVFGDGRPILAILPALALTLSAFPLYWFARKQVGRVVALIIVSAFFLSPGVQYLGTYQFYEVILVVPLLMFAMFFLTRYRYSAFLVCLGLSLLVKEEIAITTIGFGIFLALCQRKIVPGLLLSSAALVWILALLSWVLPALQGGTNYFFSAEVRSGLD